MDSTDAHLEAALAELNDRVGHLEEGGISEELMEAYVNRGCVLWMMEYRTSAMDDLQTASGMLEALESMGAEADPGTFVRIHTTMACILFDQDGDCTGEYAAAATRLGGLRTGSRHFDARSIVRTCVDACKNLIDSDAPGDILPYLEKGLSLTVGREDAWSLNRRLELTNLGAEADSDLDRHREAAESYGRAIDVGMELMERGQLEDPEELVMSFVMKAEAEEALGLSELRLQDIGSAITILEGLLDMDRVPDPEVLVGLHHDMAEALMGQGRIGEAERHLIRAMEIGINGAGDYIRINTPGGRASR